MCEPLMPDDVASKAQSQLCELSGSTYGFNTQEFRMVGGYMENLEKPQNCQNWGVGACLGMGACSGQYGNQTTNGAKFSQDVHLHVAQSSNSFTI